MIYRHNNGSANLINIPAASTELLGECRSRSMLVIDNRSAATEAYVRVDGDPTATSAHFWIPKGQRVTFGPGTGGLRECPTGAVYIIGSGAEASMIAILEGLDGDMV